MSILTDWEIKVEIRNKRIKINPFDESLLNGQSLDFRLGNTYTHIGLVATEKNRKILKTLPSIFHYLDPTDSSTFFSSIIEADEYIIGPGESILASMYEHIELSPNICASIRGKSSLARLHICNSEIGGFVDGGFRGILTLELHNRGKFWIKLTKGMKLGQLVFEKTNYPANDYSKKGRYLDQTAGTGSFGI